MPMTAGDADVDVAVIYLLSSKVGPTHNANVNGRAQRESAANRSLGTNTNLSSGHVWPCQAYRGPDGYADVVCMRSFDQTFGKSHVTAAARGLTAFLL